MLELFLIYLWEHKLLQLPLYTTAQDAVEILSSGKRNTDSGPDFVDARIKIGDIVWAGSIEMHINASDWYRHGHQSDPAYNNVVLHVVYEPDKEVADHMQRPIPTLSVKDRFDPQLLLRYRSFIDSRSFIACEKQLASVQRFTWLSWLDRMASERLQEKVEAVLEHLKQSGNDWDEIFYRQLLSNFGMKVNDQAFAQLARLLPLHLLLRHINRPDQIEALLFGLAGLLDAPYTDPYPNKLKQEYLFLKQKYSLTSMPASHWRFMRMRPQNFPTIRLSQFAALIHKNGRLFSKILHTETVENIMQLFEVNASEYWDNHYRFDKISKGKPKHLGKETISVLLINAVVHMLFAYGIHTEDRQHSDNALMLLENLPPEHNAVTRGYEKAGLSVTNALHSQALLHLKRNYCDKKRCLECRIGQILIKAK
ncbi:MAG: DUF2851 family protein [Bacteroidales bacterium]|jgi:hypothetical protein|nr:DUF2851 family protein [Bacteroidales bacterium]MDD3700973.1 DUF2851 family protein [Bacteroidales bacterium]MDY0370213.1 DUF2851 family protein [Bacteroidales bacterium]